MKKINILRKAGFLLFFFFFSHLTMAQAVGDYRSIGDGNWNVTSTWQTWNGSTWVTPTPGNYPGNPGGSYTVTISTGTIVTVNPDVMVSTGDIYVQGTLILNAILTVKQFGSGSAPNFYIQNGVVKLDKGMKLILPCGSNLYMSITNSTTQGLQPKDGNSDCNNNTEVIICGVKYSACTGQGNTTVGTFTDLNVTAVKVKANLSTNPNPATICLGNQVSFTGSYILSGTKTPPTSYIYTLSLQSKPSGSNYSFAAVNSINAPLNNISSGTFDLAGTYKFRLNIAVDVSGTIANNFVDVDVSVVSGNTVGAASSTPTLCINTSLTAITHATAGATGIGTAIGLPAGVTASFGGNIITISGTPTASGSFTYSIPLSGGCGSVNATGTITVTAANTAGSPSASPTVCINTALPTVTISTTGATGIQNNGVSGANGLPAGVSASWSGNTITISGTPTASGNFNYDIPLTGGCGVASAKGTITVKANNSVALTSAAGTNNQTQCINTVITPITYATTGATGATLSGLPSGVSGNWASNTVTISGTPTSVGTFNYIVTLTGGCGPVTATGTITVNPTPSATAGAALAAICQGGTSAAMGGSTGGGATGGTWSGGAGIWTNAGNPSTATYTAGASESGTVTLTLTTIGGSCGAATATKTITVNQKPTVNAGGALAAICQGGTSSAMGGSIGGGATAGSWSGGTGIWTNANNPSTATYTAGASESGNVTLTLTTSGGSCGALTATKTITVNPSPTANTGGALGAICQGGTSSTMGGSIGGGATGGTWSGGAGTWTNANNPLTATYTAGASESGTITLTLTTSGGSCGTVTATKTITVNPAPTANAGAALTAICQGATSSSMGGSIGGGATGGTWSGGTGTWANANNPSTATYTAGASESGTVTLTLTTSGGSCGALTATKTIMVNALAFASVTGNNRICKNTDAVFHLTGTPGVTVTYNVNGVNQTTAVLDGSGKATVTVSSAAVNQTLNIVSVSNGTCTNSEASSATVTVGEDSIYPGGGPDGWSKGRPDGNGLNAVIAGNYNTSNGNINACNCTVSGSLTVAKDTSIEIQNSFVNNGTVTVESDGNFKQVNDVPNPPNSGAMTVKRNVKFRNDNRQEYNYLISPVIGQSLKTIYPGVPTTATYPYVLYYNEANNYFYNSSGAYIAGRGLAVKEPSKADVPADNMDAVFNGVPGNGVISFPLAHTNNVQNGYNLVGNPYPSNIDLQKLYLLNGGATASPKISSTFQFWDNGANNIYTQQGSGYSGRAYAVYNAANNTGNAAGYLLSPSQILTAKVPNETAKVGQGFMVRATGGGNLVFNNDIRSNNTGAGFFSKGTQSPADRYWLKLVTPVNAVNTIAVVYFAGGSNAFGMDDSGMNGDSSDMLYSLAEGNKLQIEGKPMFEVSDKIILGSRHFAAGNYTFALDKAEGVFANGQHIYLKDKQTGIITNLSEGSYTFAANAGESTGRFEIIYQSETVLATDGTVKDDLLVYRDGDDFVIDSKGKKITQVEVYDSSGRLSLKTEPGSLKTVIPAISLSNGVYILKINQAGKITNRKIIR